MTQRTSQPVGMLAYGVLVIAWLAPGVALAEELFVGAGEAHATIQSALEAAGDGDVITVRDGTYDGALTTRAPDVTLRADAGATVIATTSGRVIEIAHPRFVVEGLIFDGQFGGSDAIVAREAASDLVLRRVEVRNAGRDCIDIRGRISDVLIEDSTIHHCLWATASNCSSGDCRGDAHGVVGDQAQRLTIRNTEIHSFSGDALQMNGRDQATIWNDVRIEGCHFWLGPLPEAAGGFAAGVVPGENAIDTKTPDSDMPPAQITIVDTIANGFRAGLIGNMAAYNMKENVLAVFDRVSVYDNEIGFRLRGAGGRPRGAQVTIRNAVLWDSDYGVRYEEDIAPIRIENSTWGGGVTEPFRRASAPEGVVMGANVLVLGGSLPAEIGGGSNLAVDASAFVDAAGHDYHLSDGSPAIDAGETLESVPDDRDAVPRPQGASYDVGAYEHCGEACVGAPDGGPMRTDGGRAEGDDGGVIVLPDGAVVRVDAGGGMDRDGGGGVDGGGGDGCGCRAAGAGARANALAPLLLGMLIVVAARRRGRR